MKKVLFTATVDSHILQFHLPFLKIFKDKGYEVHVATNGTEEIPYCDVKHTVSFERSPFKINNLKAIKQLKKIIEEEKFDIIHTHTPMGSVVTRLAAKNARKKYHTRVIYTAHGLHFFKGAPLKNWIMFYPVEKYLSKYTDTLILINQEDYELCKRKFKKCKDIQYVPGVGIDEEKFNFTMTEEEKLELRESLGLKKDDFVMIYPAEISKRKRQEWLINSISNLLKANNNIHLLLPGQDSLNGKCQKLVKQLNLEDQIHFLGYRKDIPKLLKISDLAVSSASQEGLPVNIMEAMYVGLPIVASDCRGNRDLVKDGINGYLVNINNQKRFNNCIEKLYLLQDENNKFSEQSKIFIKEYLLNNIIENLKKIYFKKKKVLHILSSNIYSGAENVACTIIDKTKDKYDTFYCCPRGLIEKQLKEKKINYIPIKKVSYVEIRKIINKSNYDIIHAHDNKASVISSFFYNKHKIISHIHGNNKIMNSINLKTILFNWRSKKIDKFIWVSDSSLNDYCFKKNVVKKSIVLFNVINKEEILKKSMIYTCDENYDMIFLGRLAYPKNPERLIEIMKLLKTEKKDIKLAIVGDGIEKDKITNLMNKYKLKNNIKIYGYQNNPYPILSKSKILIMTSIYEGTPMCALEAQCLGKPVIATPVDGLKGIITNDENGYLVNSNKQYVEKIIYLLNDEKKYQKMSKKASECFDEYNDLKKYINQIKKLYL